MVNLAIAFADYQNLSPNNSGPSQNNDPCSQPQQTTANKQRFCSKTTHQADNQPTTNHKDSRVQNKSGHIQSISFYCLTLKLIHFASIPNNVNVSV